MKKNKKNKKHTEFSKKLLAQESILIWIVTIGFLILSFICIQNQYFGELPWLTAMAACPWAAYAVGQGFYYRKAERENTKGGLKYESIMAQYYTDNCNPVIVEEENNEEACG